MNLEEITNLGNHFAQLQVKFECHPLLVVSQGKLNVQTTIENDLNANKSFKIILEV